MEWRSQLDEGMDVCFVSRPEHRAAAVAVSRSGASYIGAQFDSATKVLNFSPEQTALLSAVQHKDYDIQEVVAIHPFEPEGEIVSPLNLKFLIDFSRRTNTTLQYRVNNVDGSTAFATDDVETAIPWYKPNQRPIYIKSTQETNKFRSNGRDMKSLALNGISRAFTTYPEASRYGAAIKTMGQNVFTSGQYSSYEGRLNIHAEVGAVIAALLAGEQDLTDLAVVSEKQAKHVCTTCGMCLQFLTEVSDRYDLQLNIENHASQSDSVERHLLSECLPYTWSPKDE